MASGYRYPVVNSDGTFSSTIEDFDDNFVPKDNFLNSGLWSWGYASYGDLGQGNLTGISSPQQVGLLTNWKQIGGYSSNSAGIKTDGTLWTWGGGLGGTGQGNTTQISSPQQVGTLTNWKQISTNGTSFHMAAIKTDGTLWAWGTNSWGQLGNGAALAVSSPVQIGSLTNWKQINTGYQFTMSVKTDGSLWAWGQGSNGALGIGTTTTLSSPQQVGTLTNWKLVAGGYYHASAVKTDGTLWAWGHNAWGQLGLGDIVHRSSPVQIGSLTNWKLVSCGQYYTAAIKTDGTLWAWGYNANGQLGLGDILHRSSPVQIGSLTNWKQIAGGGSMSNSAIRTDGTLWAWGHNAYGQLGLGDIVHRSSPVQVGLLTNWKLTTGGGYWTLAINSADLPN